MPFNSLIDPKQTNTLTWCEIRGVPRGILHGMYDTDWTNLIHDFKYNNKDVSRQRQLNWWKMTNAQIFEGTPLIGIVGTNQSIIDQVALYIFLTAYYQSNPQISMPYWHVVTGSRNDDLRDGNKAEFMSPINLLILNNVATGASYSKIEKTRDLISLYDYVPRVVVIGAKDPAQFFLENLAMTPTRIIFVDDLK